MDPDKISFQSGFSPDEPEKVAAYIQELERQLAETQANLRTMAAAQIDAVLESGKTTPLLLREAQAALQRSKAELEQKVAERTAELNQANDRLVEINQELAAQNEKLLKVRENLEFELVERKRAENELRERERFIQGILDISPAVLYLYDLQKHHSSLNTRQIWEFLGYTGTQIQALEDSLPDSLMHPDDRERFPAHLERLASLPPGESAAFEYRMRDSKGGWLWFYSRDTVLERDSAGRPVKVLGAALDVTELRTAEQLLWESEARFKVMADGTPVIMWVTDTSGRMEFINRAYSEFFGVELEDVRSAGWEPLVHPDDIESYVDEFNDCMRECRPFRAQGRVRRHDGEWRWIYSHGQPRFAESGDFLGMVGSSLDITDQKKSEADLQKFAMELARSNRDLEEFAFVASHDLQEPLRKVHSFGEQLKSRFGRLLGEEGSDYIDRMQKATERMQRMIAELLDYSRVTTKDQSFRSTDLNTVAQEVLSDLESRIAHCQGRVELGDLPTIDADPLQMHQLLQNLIGNALKFHPAGTAPVVKVGVKSSTSNRIEIFVEDNGIGFDINNLERIFQPFQRLHGRGEYDGNGMGLAICRKIVESHGGSITAESSPGKGATFLVTLPVQQTEN